VWLRRHLDANAQAYKDFLADEADIRQLILTDAFPYQAGPLPPKISGIVLPLLLSWAETTVAGHQFLRRLIAGLVRSDEPVPDDWRGFHADVLDGTTREPRSPRGRKAVHERRDDLISFMVTILQSRFDLPRLANPANRNGESALEIVKVELAGILPDLNLIEVEALEKAIMRRAKEYKTDPILSVMDRRT